MPDDLEQTAEGDVYIRPRGLPMGFRNSCAIWTAIARTLTKKWRAQGIRCIHYIGDFRFCASTQEEALRIRDVVLHDIIELPGVGSKIQEVDGSASAAGEVPRFHPGLEA